MIGYIYVYTPEESSSHQKYFNVKRKKRKVNIKHKKIKF